MKITLTTIIFAQLTLIASIVTPSPLGNLIVFFSGVMVTISIFVTIAEKRI